MRARTPKKHTKYSFPETNETMFGRKSLGIDGSENREATYGVTNMRYDEASDHYMFDFYNNKEKKTSIAISRDALQAGSPIGFEYGTIGMANYGLHKPDHKDMGTIDKFIMNIPEIKNIAEIEREGTPQEFCEKFNATYTKEMIENGGMTIDGKNVSLTDDGTKFVEEITLDIDILGENVGKAIGKDGVNIKQIEEETKIRIDLGDKEKTAPGEIKTIKFKGPEEQVSHAVMLLKEKTPVEAVRDKDGNFFDYEKYFEKLEGLEDGPEGNTETVSEGISEGESESEVEDLNSRYAQKMTVDIGILGENVGKAIGKKGVNVKQIEEETGVTFYLGEKGRTAPGDVKTMSFRGTEEQVAHAITMLKDKTDIEFAKYREGGEYFDYEKIEEKYKPSPEPESELEPEPKTDLEPEREPEMEPEVLTFDEPNASEEHSENFSSASDNESSSAATDIPKDLAVDNASEPEVYTFDEDIDLSSNIIDNDVAEGLNETAKLSAREELDKAMYLDNYVSTYGDLDRADHIPDGYEEVWRVTVETDQGSRDMYFPLGEDGPSEELKDFFAPLMTDGDFERKGRTFMSDEIAFTITTEAHDLETAQEYIKATEDAINGAEMGIVGENGETETIQIQASEPYSPSAEPIAEEAPSDEEEYVFDSM